MPLDVIFSDRAHDTFDSIGEQIRIRWGEQGVNEFRKRTYKLIAVISRSPFMSPPVNGIENTRKAFVHKNCSMFYFVGDNYIEILFFWDNRQEPIFL